MRVWYRVGCVAAAVMLAAGCASPTAKSGAPSPKPEAEKKDANLPQHIRLSGGEFVLTSPDGKRLWQGEGKSFDWDTRAQVATLEDARCTFFEGGKVALKGAAPRVRVDYEARVVYLEGSVKAQSVVTGASFTADRAEWRARERKVRARGDVELVRGQSSATGDRLSADTALRRVRLEGRPVTLRIAQTPGRPLW